MRAQAAQVVVDEAQAAEAAILTHTIPWEVYLTSGVLSDRDVQMIRRFDKRDKFTQAALWEKARIVVPPAATPLWRGTGRTLPHWPAGAARRARTGGRWLRRRVLQRLAQREQGRHDAVRAGAAG